MLCHGLYYQKPGTRIVYRDVLRSLEWSVTIKSSQRQVGGQNERVRPGYFRFKKCGFSIGEE